MATFLAEVQASNGETFIRLLVGRLMVRQADLVGYDNGTQAVEMAKALIAGAPTLKVLALLLEQLELNLDLPDVAPDREVAYIYGLRELIAGWLPAVLVRDALVDLPTEEKAVEQEPEIDLEGGHVIHPQVVTYDPFADILTAV